MLKITARYTDEADLLHFIEANSEKYTIKCKPVLAKPVQKRPGSDYYKREMWLDRQHTKPANPHR